MLCLDSPLSVKIFFVGGGDYSGQKKRDGSFYATRIFVGPHGVSFISVSESAREKEKNFHKKSGYKNLIFDLAYLKDVSITTVARILRFRE